MALGVLRFPHSVNYAELLCYHTQNTPRCSVGATFTPVVGFSACEAEPGRTTYAGAEGGPVHLR